MKWSGDDPSAVCQMTVPSSASNANSWAVPPFSRWPAASALPPPPPLSCRYFGQEASAADADAAPSSSATPPAASRIRRSSASLVAIDAIGIEMAGGVALIDAAAGDAGRAEDHRRLRIDDGSAEHRRTAGARDDGR